MKEIEPCNLWYNIKKYNICTFGYRWGEKKWEQKYCKY